MRLLIPFLLIATTAWGDSLDEVVVTASRLPEPNDSLPQSISVIGQSSLQTVAAVHPAEVLYRSPGVWISRGNGLESLTAIRSPVFSGAGACGEFLLAENGIALSANGFCNVNELFDANTEQAARIEVQRGPGSVVFGSNALHGVINVITATAPATPLLETSLEAGPHDYTRLGVQAGDQGFLVQATGTHDSGYKNHSGYDQQKLSLAHHADREGVTVDTQLTAMNLNQETAGYVEGHDAYKVDALQKANPNPEAYRDAQAIHGSSRWQWHDERDDLWSVTPYFRDNRMNFLQHFVAWKPEEDNSQSSLGVQSAWQHRDGPRTWLAGVDAEYTQGSLKETQDHPFSAAIPAGVHYDYSVNATTAAPYARLQWAFSDTWTGTAGARYEAITYDYHNHASDGSACAPGVKNCRFYRPADTSDHFDLLSPSLGIVGQLNQTLRVFAQAAEAYRAPQTTELYRLQGRQATADLEPVKLDSIEAGWQQDIGKADYRVTLFSMHKDHEILQDSQRWNVGDAKTSHDGVEIALHWPLTDTLALDVDATYAAHRYINNENLPGLARPIQGRDVDTAPRDLGSARLTWAPTATISSELECVAVGRYYTDPENLHSYPGHHLLHLRLAWQATPRWKVSARITNLANAEYADRADYAFGTERYFIGEPRSLFLGIDGKLF